MNETQRRAIQNHRLPVCRALQSSAQFFLTELEMHSILSSAERQSIERRAHHETDKILRCLDILQDRDGGYAFLISHLRQNMMSNLADELNSAVQTATSSNPGAYLLDGTDLDIIKKLTADCVDFYLGNFRTVEGFDGDTEPIESVWVSLQLEGDFRSSTNYEDIFVRMAQNNCRVAVVKGQPGSGKTTLIKKIAYDWAKLKQNEVKTAGSHPDTIETKTTGAKFDLILAAQLRSIQVASDPIEMAVEFLLEAVGPAAYLPNIQTISDVLKRYNLKILVILDGLDEYQHQPNSFLAKMFGSALASTVSREAKSPIHLKYDLLVTSRPYACKTVNKNLLTHKWEIAGLTEESQLEFVQLRCKTERGKVRAAEYLRNSSVLSEIGSIPLLLLLVCFLSDRNVDIPAKLTKLYEMFIRQMLIRSAEKEAIATFDTENWKSSLVEILSRLALMGVLKNKFEFSRDEREMCKVGDDSFASGLLLLRSDPSNFATKADFPHRSIQEFLAALHYVDFLPTNSTTSSATGWPERIGRLEGISEIKVEMLVATMIEFADSGDSQFCRFYLGLLSGHEEFEVKMRKSLEEYLDIGTINFTFLCCLTNSLADCSDAECFLTGQIVNSLVDKSFNRAKSGWTEVQLKKRNLFKWAEGKRMNSWPDTTRTELRPQLLSGLKLKWLGRSPDSFYLRSESQSELKMIFIQLNEENLVEKVGKLEGFEQVEWLWIRQSGSFDAEKLKFTFEQIKRLPKCRNCLIIDVSAKFSVIRLWMGRKSARKRRKCEFPDNSGHSTVNPEFIRFQVWRSLGENILRKFSSLRQSDSGEVEIESIEEISEGEGRVAHVRLAVSSSWSVWDFLRSEAVSS